MKKTENKKIIKEYQNELSPAFHKKKIYFSKSSFKSNEKNNILLSPKKTQDELILPKKKIIPHTSNHRRSKSNSGNYIHYMANNNSNLNQSRSKISFIFRKNDLKKYNLKNNYSLMSRNKNIIKNFNDIKNKSNLLSLSFSLKDFKNNIMNAFSHSNLNKPKINKKNNVIKIKKNKSLYKFDNTNIEETRNTTSITCFNNSNLLYNKKHNLKENENPNSKSIKYIKINRKSNMKLFSAQKSPLKKIITYTNREVIKEKNNVKFKCVLHNYIYKNNIKGKNKNNKIKNTNNLILAKKHYKNTQNNFSKKGKNKIINIFCNPISEMENDNYKYYESYRKKQNINKIYCCSSSSSSKNKNINKIYCCSSSSSSKNKNIQKKSCLKNKKKKNNSQENNCKIGVNYDYSIKEFKSVEEIHFIYVEINQRKKEYFSKNNMENNKY